MIPPNLPENDPLTMSLNNSSVSQKQKKSNLKRTLSEQFRLSTEDSEIVGQPLSSNNFYVKTENGIRIYKRRIICVDGLEENPKIQSKKLKFRQTQVYLVDNWKEHNKRKKPSVCWCFWK